MSMALQSESGEGEGEDGLMKRHLEGFNVGVVCFHTGWTQVGNHERDVERLLNCPAAQWTRSHENPLVLQRNT